MESKTLIKQHQFYRYSSSNLRMEIAAPAHLHHLHGRLDIIAVRIVHQMRKRGKRMVQRLGWSDTPFLVDGQHSLQQIDKLTAIRLFGQQLAALQIGGHVHLANVVEAIKDVLACLLAFGRRFGLVFFGRLESPKGIRRVDVAIEEFGSFAGAVEHVFGGKALRLRDVPLV